MRTLLLLLLGAVFSQNSQCPLEKTVGGTCFSRMLDKIDTSKYNCTSNCTYVDQYGDMFCFKPGPYEEEDTCAPNPKLNETEVPGEECNRDCIQDQSNKTCVFTFVLEQLFSDTLGRLADGRNRSVLVYNGQLPGPTIAICEGDNVVLKLKNHLKGDDPFLLGAPFDGGSCQGPKCYLHSNVPFNSTTLHFHGIREKQLEGSGSFGVGGPWSDGVPLVSQCPVPASSNFNYTFLGSGGINAPYNNAPAGTYWYHSHIGRQRMNGAQGKLIIMPRTKSSRYDVDLPENSLFLQEWYPNTDDATPHCLLVNGKGKQSKKQYTCKGDDCIRKYKEGEPVEFVIIKNSGYNIENQPNYEVFNITVPGERYRFRIIGGIGDDVPIRVSVENHTFSAIAADSIDIESVDDLDAIWVAAGERYDIVIKTTSQPREREPYQINVVHIKTSHAGAGISICSLAWLKYPNQEVNHSVEADCEQMQKMKFKKVLNPVPTNFSNWGQPERSGETEYIYPINLTSLFQANEINTNPLNTHYMSMHGMKFNNFSMSFPKNYSAVPFLFQSPSNNTERCGVVCQYGLDTECKTQQPDRCGTEFPPPAECNCQHVIQLPWLPGQYWFEIILINVKQRNATHADIEDGWGVAHPIHQHGGWFNIVGMGQFDQPIFRETIMKMDRSCKAGKQCLPRKFDRPVFKDVIQVPTNGYVIFRTPMDNRGAWIVHCHINWHVEHGMAMVFQIGEPDGPFRWAMGPDTMAAVDNMNKNCFTGQP